MDRRDDISDLARSIAIALVNACLRPEVNARLISAAAASAQADRRHKTANSWTDPGGIEAGCGIPATPRKQLFQVAVLSPCLAGIFAEISLCKPTDWDVGIGFKIRGNWVE